MIVGEFGSRTVHHSVRTDFGDLLREALKGNVVYSAMGPIYEIDPGAERLAPFIRSATEVGLDHDIMAPSCLAPENVWSRVNTLRREEVERWIVRETVHWKDVEDWTRAGLVLEVASRLGISLQLGTRAHVKWKMKGTVTGRFGVEPGGFNPMVISREKPEKSEERKNALWRSRVVPSAPGRYIVVIDFRAMDLSSMVSVVPGLRDRYQDTTDLHARTAELVGIERDAAKLELFVHGYGGHSAYAKQFEKHLPELSWLRNKPHGEGARLVQRTSATAFKAALSNALPLLVGDDIRPMFTVHDELTLDVLYESMEKVKKVTKALEVGASERIGMPYTVGVKVGRDYAEAKL